MSLSIRKSGISGAAGCPSIQCYLVVPGSTENRVAPERQSLCRDNASIAKCESVAMGIVEESLVSLVRHVHRVIDSRLAGNRESDCAVSLSLRDSVSIIRFRDGDYQNSPIQLLPIAPSTMERIPSPMARNRKRSSRRESASQETEFYVTVAHERGSACDSCAQPRPVLIETEDGQWWCEVCTGQVDGDELWRAAVISLMVGDSL